MKKKIKIFAILMVAIIALTLNAFIQVKADDVNGYDTNGDEDNEYFDFGNSWAGGSSKGSGTEGGGVFVASGEDVQSHKYDLFCVKRGQRMPYIYYGNAGMKSSGKNIDNTLEADDGSKTAELYSADDFLNMLGTVHDIGGGEVLTSLEAYWGYILSRQQAYTRAIYANATPRAMEPTEYYIFANTDKELIQNAIWDYNDGTGTVIPSGGTATRLVDEAKTYEAVISSIISPSLNSGSATASYSFSKKEFLIGPFSLNYTRYYINSTVAGSAIVQKHGSKINFSGIINSTLKLDDKTITLSASNFYFPNGRSAEAAAEPDYQYPYPSEEFYIRLSMAEVGDAKKVENLKFKFIRYVQGQGQIIDLTGGFYGIYGFEPKHTGTECNGRIWVPDKCSGGWEDSKGRQHACEHGNVGYCGEELSSGHWDPCPIHGTAEAHYSQVVEVLKGNLITTVNGAQDLVQVVGEALVRFRYNSTTSNLDLSLRMNYGGVVWEDSYTGKLQDQDGLYAGVNSEKGVENVRVTIYNKEDNMPYASTYTDKNGRYLFEQIKMGQYYAIFDYDGQVWENAEYFAGGEENFATNSKAQEYKQDRIDFNNKFKEIIEQGGVAADGRTITPIEYDTNTLGKPYAITNSGNKELSNAKQFGGSITSNYGGNVEGDYASYKMSATTMDNNNNIISYPRENEVHIEDWNKQIADALYTALYPKIEQINLGLTRRTQADFDVKKDVYKVIVQIDGKTEEYTYSSRQNITESFDVDLKHSPDYENLTYNRAIYKSDYNYRISDYNTGKALTEDSDRKDGGVQDIVDAITSAKAGSELRVFVIYKLTFRNASEIYSGTVNELVDYYDEELSYTGESWYGTPKTTENVVEWVEAPKYGAAKEYPGLDTLYTTTTSNIMLKSGDQEEIYMKFEVKKHTDESGKENSIWLDENSETGEALGGKNNIVEITNYSTYKEGTTIEQKNNPENIEGKIDRDSKPNNTNPNDRATIEDDTDGAPTLNIILNKGEERNIGGIIWEDERNNTLANSQEVGNGIREENETKINGAVVQLIEKVEIDGNIYEYIWREMETGDNTYKYLDYNGNVQTGSITREDGKYFFDNYKPGNYIIRVIYGDNDHTIQIRANSANGWNDKSYNGQDYKSTIYKAVETNGYYDQAANAANPNASKAKDNAIRRLNVNAYSHTMSNHIGNVLAAPYNFPNDADLIKELRDNTWIYADTAVIVSEVEYNTQATDNLADSQKTSLVYNIENVGMGLEERPRTNIELAKELDNAVVTLGGGTVMLDVKNGITEHLQRIPSKYDINEQHKTISPNGYWQYETDKELLQGTQLKLYYKLTVKNTGQVDTVGRTYDLNRRNSISLKEAEEMLGSAYYYGTLDNVQPVTTSVDKIADYVDRYIGYDPNAETNKENNWGELIRDLSELQESGIISKTINITENTTNNKMLITDSLAGKEMQKDEEQSTTLLLGRLLGRDGSTYDYTYNNIAEIVEFTNTVGRRDPDQIPGNADPHIVNKVNPENPDFENVIPTTLELENDTDISQNFHIIQPTGEDKSIYNYIILASVNAAAILTLGIVLIKKYVVKK